MISRLVLDLRLDAMVIDRREHLEEPGNGHSSYLLTFPLCVSVPFAKLQFTNEESKT